MTVQTPSRFDERLALPGPLILDGGLATQLEAQGYSLDSQLWSALLLRDDPRAIVDAHLAFFEAGAHCTISASYQATRSGLMTLGLSASEAQALIVKSVELAVAAREEFLVAKPKTSGPLLVAASVGPYGAPLGDGSEYTGDYGVDDTALIEFHRERLSWLDHSGADLLACETIPSLQEAKVLQGLLMEVDSPAWVSFSCRDGTHLNDGTPIEVCARLFKGHPRVRAIGINCTSPIYINELIGEIKKVDPTQKVVVYPNSGEIYDASNNSWHGTSSPIECGEAAQTWRQSGADIIGGCCRMGPEHIKSIKETMR